MRIALRESRVQPYGLEQFRNSLLPGEGASGQLMNIQRFADDVCDRHARVERAVGVLKNHLEPAPPRPQLRSAQPRDVFTLE